MRLPSDKASSNEEDAKTQPISLRSVKVFALVLACAVMLSFTRAHEPPLPQAGNDQSKKPNTAKPTSQNTATKPAKMKTSTQDTLSVDYREAAMLARLAIKQWADKEYADREIQETYGEAKDKATTVAHARAKNSADYQLTSLLERLQTMVLKIFLIDTDLSLRRLSLKMSEKTDLSDVPDLITAHGDLYDQYLKCDNHIEASLSEGKYKGDGPCPAAQ